MRPDFPHALDSTMVGTFRSCPQKMLRQYVQHWKPKSESVHLVAGGAFAKGLEVARRAFYEQGLPAERAEAQGLKALLEAYGGFEPPEDSAKSPLRMAGALEFYFANYPLATDYAQPAPLGGQPAIEFSFAEPLEIMHPVTGDPILYTGRADMICDFAGGRWIEDDKTTKSLGQYWSQQWDLRSQFTGYCWAASRAGIKVDGVLVRGVAILKTEYKTAEALAKRSTWEIARWHEQLHRDIERMLQCWEEGYWDYNLDHACTEYGGCSLRDICRVPNPEEWLPINHVQRIWDPLAREERALPPEEMP